MATYQIQDHHMVVMTTHRWHRDRYGAYAPSSIKGTIDQQYVVPSDMRRCHVCACLTTHIQWLSNPITSCTRCYGYVTRTDPELNTKYDYVTQRLTYTTTIKLADFMALSRCSAPLKMSTCVCCKVEVTIHSCCYMCVNEASRLVAKYAYTVWELTKHGVPTDVAQVIYHIMHALGAKVA